MIAILIALSILITWAVCAFTLIGLGCLTLRPFSRDFGLEEVFWIGMASAVAVLLIWHFLEPVNFLVDSLIFLLGIFGCILNRTKLLQAAKRVVKAGFWPLTIYWAALFSLAFRATGPCEHFDTGLYGATAIRWITSYPIVPGLANLHGRLGFNSTVFLAIAALGQGGWRDAGHHLFTGLMVAGFLATIGPSLVRVFGGTSIRASDWFSTILIIPAIYWTTRGRLVGTMTDLPATIVSLVAIRIIVAELEYSHQGSKSRNFRFGIAMVMFALAVTFKLSVAVFGASVLLLILLFVGASNADSKWKSIPSWIAISSALIFPWIISNIVLTGYPFYPQSILGSGFDWRVSVIACKWELAWIRSWSRVPFVDLAQTQGLGWIKPWLSINLRSREPFQVPLGMAALGVGGMIVLARRQFTETRAWLAILVPAAISLIFWFLEAPATRFAESSIWTLAAVLGTGTLTSVGRVNQNKRYAQVAGLGIILIGIWCIAPHRLWKTVYSPLLSSDQTLTMPSTEVIPTLTSSGLLVFWRADGQQCWDAPLPCTPYFNKTLRLRSPGNMRWGFNVDSPQSFADIARTWARPACSTSDVDCFARREISVNRDHGGE